MNHGSVFTGEGGFDIASEWMGWNNVFHCELNDNLRWFLENRWSKAKSYADITKTDFTIWRGKLDILTGGFPCQPYSQSGKRLGKEDDRHLWPEMRRAIRESQPAYVVGENVRGLINWNGGLVFDEVQADLEAEGYEVQPFLLPAAGVGAPHERYRIWFVAYSEVYHARRASGKNESQGPEEWLSKRNEIRKPSESDQIFGDSSNSDGFGLWNKGDRIRKAGQFSEVCSDGNTPNSDIKRLQRRSTEYGIRPKTSERQVEISCSGQIWQNFPTQSPICSGNDGFSSESLRQFIREDSNGCLSEKEIDKIFSEANSKFRKEVLMAGGNAVVPQVPMQIFKAIEEYEKL